MGRRNGRGERGEGGRDMGRLVYVWCWTIKGQSRGEYTCNHYHATPCKHACACPEPSLRYVISVHMHVHVHTSCSRQAKELHIIIYMNK